MLNAHAVGEQNPFMPSLNGLDIAYIKQLRSL
jgi:hypothetical protein